MPKTGLFQDRDIGGYQYQYGNALNCKKITVVGSIKELKELSAEGELKGDFIHRPHVDEIIIHL